MQCCSSSRQVHKSFRRRKHLLSGMFAQACFYKRRSRHKSRHSCPDRQRPSPPRKLLSSNKSSTSLCNRQESSSSPRGCTHLRRRASTRPHNRIGKCSLPYHTFQPCQLEVCNRCQRNNLPCKRSRTSSDHRNLRRKRQHHRRQFPWPALDTVRNGHHSDRLNHH